MALSNWLTRDEWNACYFAGIGEMAEGKQCENLSDQMRLGISALHRAGYEFKGILSNEDGSFEKVVQCCDGNETVLAEIMGACGGFDRLARAREVLDWTGGPKFDWSWLAEAVEAAETNESTP